LYRAVATHAANYIAKYYQIEQTAIASRTLAGKSLDASKAHELMRSGP
jgi:hypothetical protein